MYFRVKCAPIHVRRAGMVCTVFPSVTVTMGGHVIMSLESAAVLQATLDQSEYLVRG